jgi:hypothetical protein
MVSTRNGHPSHVGGMRSARNANPAGYRETKPSGVEGLKLALMSGTAGMFWRKLRTGLSPSLTIPTTTFPATQDYALQSPLWISPAQSCVLHITTLLASQGQLLPIFIRLFCSTTQTQAQKNISLFSSRHLEIHHNALQHSSLGYTCQHLDLRPCSAI